MNDTQCKNCKDYLSLIPRLSGKDTAICLHTEKVSPCFKTVTYQTIENMEACPKVYTDAKTPERKLEI